MASELSDFSLRLTGAVKAELARRDLSGVDLVVPLKLNRNAIYSRLKGERAFDTNELEAIANFLEISMDTLLASAAVGVSAVAA